MAAPKFGKHLPKGRKVGRPLDLKTEQINFLVWTDLIDGIPATESAEKLGVTRQAIESRRSKLKHFVDPTGTLLENYRGAISMLAVDALNTLHYHITERKDKDLAIRILENIEALKRVDLGQSVPGGSVSVQQFFTGLAQVPDVDRNRIRSGLATAFAETTGR
jgi:hypothetical protein